MPKGWMRRFCLRLPMLCLLAALPGTGLHAQAFKLETQRVPLVSLDGLWRFHTGDNPEWASPNFDDSNWSLLRSDESWTRQGYPGFTGYAWYRFKVEVPGNGRPVGLLLARMANGYQVYADGKLLGSAGAAVGTRDPVFESNAAIYTLPTNDAGPHDIQIALRVWSYRPSATWVGAGSMSMGNEAGDPVLLSYHLRSGRSYIAGLFVNEYAYGLFAALIGFAILALFLLRPTDKEYLWFSVLLLAESAESALHLMLNLGQMPFPLWNVLAWICSACSVIAALMFFSIVLRQRRSWLWWIICLLVAASPLTAALIYFQWTSVGISFAIAQACTVPAYVWVIAVLLMGVFRKDASARLLLLPVTLSYGIDFIDTTARIAWQLNVHNFLPDVNFLLFERPFPLNLTNIVYFIFILALLIFLVRRFSLARSEEERLVREFEAARNVQALLIPTSALATPGFAVETVYLPASEVGGDFFHIHPGSDGSLLVVAGDVSGKGLKAAMTVSAIIGALRGCEHRQPAAVLAYLNGVLHGNVSGFVTCTAALIAADGSMTVANAGNPAPYCNGKEMSVEPGLPLGILPENNYAETKHLLQPGDRLTFASDGVVEATNEKRELFGFDRTQAISTQPAASIADAAQRFGQQDDISVIAVTRIAVEASVPA
jgi:Stage II sporulation protein E (SpoIIE)